MSTDILYSVDQGVATISLNRPDKMNAITASMLDDFFARVAQAGADPQVRVILVTGQGRAFCAGTDLSALPEDMSTLTEVPGILSPVIDPPQPQWGDQVGPALEHHFNAGWSGLIRCRKPTIAAINGPAFGWGAILALHCDIRFAARSAVMNFTFTRLGVPAEKASAWLLTRLIGSARSADLLYSARTIDMDFAERIGLLNAVYDADALLPLATGYARQLALNAAPRALATIKAQIWMALDESYAEAYRKADEEQLTCMRSADASEGVASYLEKRTPNFTGR